MLVQDLVTVNQALDLLQFPPIQGPDGDLTVAEYIAQKGFIRGAAKPINYYEKVPNTFIPNDLAPEDQIPQPLPPKNQPSPAGNQPAMGAESMFDSFEDWLTEMHSVVKSKMDPHKKEQFIIDGLKQFHVSPDQKDIIAELLTKAGDSLERLSYPGINRILRAVCKKGCSFSDLSKYRN
jgi:hypothetical protein